MPVMAYDIEADWQLLNTCNYGCEYCFLSPELLREKLVQYATPAVWEQAFAATGLTWLLHLTGGEPSIYPRFAELCETLSARHYLSINSNLTNRSWLDFAARIDPARISFINAGLHYNERNERSGFASFAAHLSALRAAGFRVFVSLVATPEVLAEQDIHRDRLNALGIVPYPKVIRGFYRGRNYPDSYTADERNAFLAMASRARAGQSWDFSENPSIDLNADVEMLAGIEDFTGKICAAGQKFVSLRENGDAFRCSNKQRLGNLLDGTLILKTRPARCDTSYCPYFCRKYTSLMPGQKRQTGFAGLQRWRGMVAGAKAGLRDLLPL